MSRYSSPYDYSSDPFLCDEPIEVGAPQQWEPDWVREPDDDYDFDADPGYDSIENRGGIPMMIFVGGTVATWDEDTDTFIQAPFTLDENGKVVARHDGS